MSARAIQLARRGPLAPFREIAGGLEPTLPLELSSSATPGARLFAALWRAPHLPIVEDVKDRGRRPIASAPLDKDEGTASEN